MENDSNTADNSSLGFLQLHEFADNMYSPESSPKFLMGNACEMSLDTIDRTTIDDYDVCELDFIEPTSNWQAEADSFEYAAADYPCRCLPSQSNNGFASLDLLIHSQMGIDNAQPSVPIWEDSTITVSTEGINSSWEAGLGYSFDQKRNSAFVKWKAGNPNLQHSCKPINHPSLQKRCIRFLNDINNHKIRSPRYINNCDDWSMTVCNNYDKLAIHHVVAERKRRGQMNDIFSALRAVVPVKPKKAGRATVLLQTKDYVIHLKKCIQQLEQRNRELEALLLEKSLVT